MSQTGDCDANWLTLNLAKLNQKDYTEPARVNTFVMLAPLLSALRYRFVNKKFNNYDKIYKILLFTF